MPTTGSALDAPASGVTNPPEQAERNFQCLADNKMHFAGSQPMEVMRVRHLKGVIPSMKRVDTCAAEFEAGTPYMYSSYDGECECEPTSNPKVLILGGGPNRIGQGIEFDYCCCHASFALRYISPVMSGSCKLPGPKAVVCTF